MSNHRTFDGARLFRGKVPHKHVPEVPTPPLQEEPVIEAHVVEEEPLTHDTRPVFTKMKERIKIPNYNHVYGQDMVLESWRYRIDNTATGNVVTIAGSTVTVAVKLAQIPNARLTQWPGANQLFLGIRMFNIAPTVIPATPGSVDVTYQDLIGGQIIPLGEYMSNANSTNFGMSVLIPTAITDPNIQNVGQLNFTLAGGATVGTINWQMAFSNAYLLPQLDAYNIKERPGNDHYFGEH